MISLETEQRGDTVLVSVVGGLDEMAGPALQQALDGANGGAQALMIDLHGVGWMDASGLLHLLDLHRRGECLGLRVLVVGWQPRQLLAATAGISGPGSASERRYALAGFRHLLTQRAHRTHDLAAPTASQVPACR
ncbi:hypothetical protein OG906_34710 (plasmid) [Streptomyces sp. NBC_01426]|uniref:STAS domain-containing protein n=1 Tax=Streptomyces sp. NBC_01426 TaxID=2975866 RepID=UPI002E2F0A7B|nr:STAS domain-containing protein [Streptomyces sp. NBC_01426]